MVFSLILIFSAALLLCVAFDVSVLYALALGFFLFFGFGLSKKFTVKEMLHMSLEGIKTVKNILLTFILIGLLTASWRASGTIATVISYTSSLIRPEVYLLVTFLLNAALSFLTGTSFGTVATMGVICMTIGATMHISPILAGGCIMSGIFFGDRCSPVSTSALLVSEITRTDIYTNIKLMCRSASVPFLVSCLLFLILGFTQETEAAAVDVDVLFSGVFRIHWAALLPAAAVLLLAVFKVKTKVTLFVSVVIAFLICFFLQGMSVSALLKMAVYGYECPVPEVAEMLSGGGLLSMVKVACIVCLSSTYSGIFKGTHMLDQVQETIRKLGDRLPAFFGILLVSIVTAMISCNQTLATMLSNQLCETLEPDRQRMAIALEDAPIVLAPLVPWSIAGAVPLATIGAGPVCLLAAFYLYLIPLWHLLMSFTEKARNRKSIF